MDDEPRPAVTDAAGKPRRFKRLLNRFAIALTVLAVCAAFVLKDYVRTLHSIRRIPGTNAYVMDYYVDYNLAEVRAHGIDVKHVEDSFLAVFFPKWITPIAASLKHAFLAEPIATIPPGEHCSSVVLHSSRGDVFFGRNLDYKHDACLIIKIHSKNDASSVAVLDLHYLNLDRDDLDQTNLIQRIPLLFAPYYLEDGMNEYGVAVSDMSVDGVRPPYDPAKPDVIHSTAMRLILDYAKNTDEAIELLKQFNIRFVAETCHLMIADASGKSAVVEFIDGQLKPTTTRENWQVCTNHQLCGKSEDQNDECCKRYHDASEELAKISVNADADAVMSVMQSVHQPSTMWSSVYDLSTGEFKIAYRQHYENPYVDQLQNMKSR